MAANGHGGAPSSAPSDLTGSEADGKSSASSAGGGGGGSLAPKSLAVAYVLWATMGLLGVHHLYLRRDKHAFLWASTLGVLGLGWLRDGWRLPEYVRDANDDPAFSAALTARMAAHPKGPPSSAVMALGQCLVGTYYAAIAMGGVFFVEELLWLCGGLGWRVVSVRRLTGDGFWESVDSEQLLPWAAFLCEQLRRAAYGLGFAFGVRVVGTVNDHIKCPLKPIAVASVIARFATITLAPEWVRSLSAIATCHVVFLFSFDSLMCPAACCA
jgi:hypothetical protein